MDLDLRARPGFPLFILSVTLPPFLSQPSKVMREAGREADSILSCRFHSLACLQVYVLLLSRFVGAFKTSCNGRKMDKRIDGWMDG
mmetsp:Transcript_17066/g.34625  ORF Transcript_17066/g.34625 Transcript_17066/m.34625 type:complete len:86 (+) Transcript_17066:743-1000(+)